MSSVEGQGEPIIKPDQNYYLYNGAEIAFETPDDGFSYFFGYYDKSPLSKDGKKLLAHRVAFDGRDVEDGDLAEIGYFELPSQTFHKIGETLAWNWQQGAHLQWMPPDCNRRIIFNDVEDGRYVSRIFDLQTQEWDVIPAPIYAIHPSGEFALGVNYERFAYCRAGYDYRNVYNEKWDVPIHPEDGIFRIDLISKDFELLITTQDIVDLKPTDGMLATDNWLEHMMWNPDGSRFLFMHRWLNNNGEQSTRLFTCDPEGGNLCFYPDVNFYSHYTWKNNNQLTVWTKISGDTPQKSSKMQKLKANKIVNVIIKPLYQLIRSKLPQAVTLFVENRLSLITFTDQSLGYEIEGQNVLVRDSHQTWYEKSSLLLNDSYEDEQSFRHLYLFHVNQGIIRIGCYFSYYNACAYRCDLHPRKSYDENFVIIDTGHAKMRSIQLIDIKEVRSQCL